MAIQVYELRLTKDDLGKLTSDERSLLILAGHASNQIVTLLKFAILSMNYESTDPIKSTASAVQTHTLLRILFGALAEGYEMLRTRFLEKPMAADQIRALSTQGSAALQKLKKYFGSGNAIIKMRNNFAYHYPSDALVESAFQASSPSDGAWVWYLSQQHANSLYLASDFVISHGLIDATGAANLKDAFAKIMDDVTTVSDSMTDLLEAIMEVIVEKRLPEKLASLPEPHEIKNAPKLKEFRIPFYLER